MTTFERSGFAYQGDINGKKILIIEDDDELRSVLAEILMINGFQVMSLAYALDLVSIARAVTPDLILLDYLLPGVTGAELYANLKKQPSTSGIPVVICSAYDPMAMPLAEDSCDAFIAKPFETNDLIGTIQDCLHTAK